MDNNNIFDDVFESLFSQTISRTSTLRRNNSQTTVKRNNSSATNKPNNLPYVKDSDKSYDTRKQELLESINNIEYGNYDQNKLDGFKSALEAYKKLAQGNDDFKKIDEQIVSDLKQCETKLNQNSSDYYLAGYFDGLYLLNTIIYRSKLSRFSRLANKFN